MVRRIYPTEYAVYAMLEDHFSDDVCGRHQYDIWAETLGYTRHNENHPIIINLYGLWAWEY